MKRLLRPRPSPAMIVALIGLFIALDGPAAALRGANSVFKDDIASNAIGKSEIRSNAVGRSEIRTDGVGKLEARADSVGNSELREQGDPDGGLTGDHIVESSLATVPRANLANAAGTLFQASRDPLFQLPAGDNTERTILSLGVPTGNYLIHGSATIDNDGGNDVAACFLRAGANFDEALIFLETAKLARVDLMLAHTYTAPGTITMTCNGGANAGDIDVSRRKIQAYPVAAVTSTEASEP